MKALERASPAALQLAQRLRQLRQERWADVRLTQGALAKALGGEEALAPATVSSWESSILPKIPPRSRLTSYARFFCTRRSVDPEPQLLPLQRLTEDEKAICAELEAELLALRAEATKPSLAEEAPVRSWHFTDAGPVTIICAQLPASEVGSFANPADPNYTELLSYADLDALVELHGHIRAENPSMEVTFKASSQVRPDDLSSHVILLGGIWNDFTQRLSAMTNLPVTQANEPSVTSGEIFVAADAEGRELRFLPTWGDSKTVELAEDVGLLARVPNPLNSSRTLTICNGIHSRGVLGAVRSLTDARIRDSNERYIMANFASNDSFAILMRVPVISGKTMSPDFNTAGSVLYQWPSSPSRGEIRIRADTSASMRALPVDAISESFP